MSRPKARKPAPTYEGKPCAHAPETHGRTRYRSSKACVACTLERAADQGPRPYVRKAEREAGRRTVRAKATPCSPAPMQIAAAPLPGAGQGDARPLDCESLAGAMKAAGLHHVAVTYLEASSLWQCVTLQAGYRGQVTRTGATMGEALQSALGATRGPMDDLLDVVG